jgi:hypothetical protein
MKRAFFVALGLVLCGRSGSAQTNGKQSVSHFFLPPIQLWEPAAHHEADPELAFAVTPSPQFSQSSANVMLNTATDDNEFRSRVIRPGQFYLTPPPVKSENRAVRAAEAIWSPEVVKIGKTSIASPLITAIKRKNPLCLLNPIFFQVSW